MKIGRNKFVSLTYQLRTNGAEGEMIEETTKDNPLEFLFGAGRMIEMFEQKLEDMETGDNFSFELKADEAYGQVNSDAIVELPKNIFEVNGAIDEDMLSVGNTIPMQDAQGNRLNGIVLEVADDTIKMDFNHPLAGEDLFFSGSILSVREATEQEIIEASQTQAGGCESGSCESGGCGSGCSC